MQENTSLQNQVIPLQSLLVSETADLRQMAIREEFRVCLGQFLTYMQRVKGFNYLSCFVSFASGNDLFDHCTKEFCEDLRAAGIDVILGESLITFGQDLTARAELIMDKKINYIIVIGTPHLLKTYEVGGSNTLELRLINYIIGYSRERSNKVIPVLLAGTEEDSLPPLLRQKHCCNLTNHNYFTEVFRLVREVNGFNNEDQEIKRIIDKFWLTVTQIITLDIENMQYTYCHNIKERLKKRQEEAQVRAKHRLNSLMSRVLIEEEKSSRNTEDKYGAQLKTGVLPGFFKPTAVPLDDKSKARSIIINFYLQRAAISLPVFNRPQPIAQSFINLAIVSQREQDMKLEDYQAGVRPFMQDDYSLAHQCIKPKQLFIARSTEDGDLKRLNVEGKAGIGKSTFCLFVCEQWANKELGQNIFAVIWVPLRHLVNYQAKYKNTIDEQDLAEFLFYVFRQEDKNNVTVDLTVAMIYQLLISPDKKAFVLDGFDEVAHLFRQQTIQAKLLHLLLGMNNYIMTSRPGYTGRANLVFDGQYEIVGFVSDDIPHYVERIYELNNKPPEQGRQLVEYLRGNRRMWGVAHVPIMLALICSVFNPREFNRQQQYVNTTEIYEKVLFKLQIQYLENQWQIPDGVSDWDEASIIDCCDPIMHFLEDLAYQATLENAVIISADLIRRILQKHKQALDVHVTRMSTFLDKNSSINIELIKNRLLKLIARAGFLIPLAKAMNEQDQEYFYVHPTFQTLLAARFYVRQLKKQPQNISDLLLQHKFNPVFTGFWSYAAGILQSDADSTYLQQFIDAILAEPHSLAITNEGALLFEICSEIKPTVKFKQREAISRFFLSWFLFAINDQAPSRNMVGPIAKNVELAKLGSEPLVQTVIHECLQKADNYTRIHIAYSLADIRIINNEITRFLIEGFMLPDKSSRFRSFSIIQSVARFYPEMVVSLQAALSHPHQQVRLYVSGTLLLINHETPLAVTTLQTICHSYQYVFRENENEIKEVLQKLLEKCYQEKPKALSKEMIVFLQQALSSPGFYTSFGWSRGNTNHCKHGVLLALSLIYPIKQPQEVIDNIKALAFNSSWWWRNWTVGQLLSELAHPESPVAPLCIDFLRELARNDANENVRSGATRVLVEELNNYDNEIITIYQRHTNVFTQHINHSSHLAQIVTDITNMSETMEETRQKLVTTQDNQEKLNAIKYIIKRLESKPGEANVAYDILRGFVIDTKESAAVRNEAMDAIVLLVNSHPKYGSQVVIILQDIFKTETNIDRMAVATCLCRLRNQSIVVLSLYLSLLADPNYHVVIIASLKTLYSPSTLYAILDVLRKLIANPSLALPAIEAMLDTLAAIGGWLDRDPGNQYENILELFKHLVQHPNAKALSCDKIIKSVTDSRPLESQLGVPIMNIVIKSQRDHWQIFQLFIINKFADRVSPVAPSQFSAYLLTCWDEIKNLPYLEMLISPKEMFSIYFSTDDQRLAHFLAGLIIQGRLFVRLLQGKLYLNEFTSKDLIVIDVSAYTEQIKKLQDIAAILQGVPPGITQIFTQGLTVPRESELKDLTPRTLVSNRLFYHFDADHSLYLGDLCAQQGQLPQAVTHWEKALEYDKNFENVIDRLARHYLNINDLDNAITYYVRLAAIKKIDAHSPYHNLACCYFARATSKHNKDDFILAKEAFENGIKKGRAVSIITEYANMLVYQHNYLAAIAQLEPIITKTHNDGLFYSMVEKLNLPQAMQNELSAYENGIEIRAITYAHYLLILSYLGNNNEAKAQDLLVSFKNDVNKNQSAIGYALLGYAYQMLRRYQEAIDSFALAMQKKSPYSLAEQNIEQCKKQLGSSSRCIP